MKANVIISVQCVLEDENVDELAHTLTDKVSAFVGNPYLFGVYDYSVELESVEITTFLCQRCERECEEYDLSYIDGYYGKGDSEKFCEDCRDEWDTILRREQDNARDDAEHIFSTTGSWS